MMPTGSGAPRSEPVASQEQLYQQLNTCIYDYFLKRGHFDIARALLQDDSVKLTTQQHVKTSPGQANGVDNDTAMIDGKDGEKLKIPDDLPAAGVPMDSQQSFLFDWFSVFWDIFLASRKKSNNSTVNQFITQVRVSLPTSSLLRKLIGSDFSHPEHDADEGAESIHEHESPATDDASSSEPTGQHASERCHEYLAKDGLAE